ncbi:MAG: tetratricopeptide repeat protein [Bacteroidales bacterium]|nr:tetratricopeptide repeat protein [Bacteroidales bacterium]
MQAFRHTLLLLIIIMLPQLIYGKVNSQSDTDNIASKDSVLIKSYLKTGMRLESVSFDSAMHYYNSALNISDKNGWTDERAKVLINIGFAYRYSLNSKKCVDYLYRGLELYKTTENDKGIADTYYNLGTFYSHFEDFAQSITCFISAIDVSKKLGDNKRLGMIYNNLGLQYYYTGQYEKSNIYQYKALEYKKIINDGTINFTYLNIGLNYYQQKRYNRSIKHYKVALEHTNRDKEIGVVATANKNIADVYVDMGKYDSALLYLDSVYTIHKQRGDNVSIARYYNKIGDIYLNKNNINKAENSYIKAVSLLSNTNVKRSLFYSYSNLAQLNLGKIEKGSGSKKLFADKALSYAYKMKMLADSSGFMNWKKDSYEILYNLYSIKGDKDNALIYATRLLSVKDSLASVNRDKVVSDLQIKYETQQKEQQIDQQRKDIDIQKSVIAQERKIRSILIIGLSVLVLLMIIICILYTQKQRTNQKLRLLSQFKDDMSGMIVHDLKTPLSTILNADVIADGEERITIVKQSALSINNLVDNILDVYRYNNADIKILLSDVNISDIVSKAVNQVVLSAKHKSINLHVEIKRGYIISADAVILERVLLNLLSNAIKFSPVGGSVHICVEIDEPDCLVISVSDNGEGVPEHMRLSVFNRFVQGANSIGRNRGSVGLGLAFCKMAVEAHKGEISVDSGEKGGARFIIKLLGVIKESIDYNSLVIDTDTYKLSSSDIEYLKPFCDKLKHYKIFQIWDINTIMKTIDCSNDNLKTWRNKIDEAVYSGNTDMYNSLINLD